MLSRCSAAIGWTLALVTAGLPLSAHAYRDKVQDEAARRFVQEFYNWYLKHSESGKGVSDAIKVRRNAFSPQLVRALKEDAAAQAKHPNEIVSLDFDPIFNGQDFAKKYLVDKVKQMGGRYFVDVYGIWNNKKDEIPSVTAELARVNGRWRFENFHYKREGKGERDDDLLHILKTLGESRKKTKS